MKLSVGWRPACIILLTGALAGSGVAPANAAAGAEEYLVAVTGDASDFRDEITAAGGSVEDVFGAVDVLAVTLPPAAAAALDGRPGVDVEPPFIARIADSSAPSYGLDRIDQRSLPLSSTYHRPSAGLGEGVDVYVMDTGIRADHVEFGGRVKAGFTAIADGLGTSDCHGHGTHVAGTAAGARVGVAPRADLIPVRVLNCSGTTTTGYEFIDGLNWVLQHHQSGTPAVLNMSLGGPANSVIDDAVAQLVADGIVVVAAGGNNNTDACSVSPARAPAAITVASSTANDSRAAYSNFGTCVDLFAPGGDGAAAILSAGAGSATELTWRAGTSMASPHAAGAAARYLSVFSGAAPVTVGSTLIDSSTPGAISDAGPGTPNRLLYVRDWLTSPAMSIQAEWDRLGGSGGVLGSARGEVRTVAGGAVRDFAGGRIHWSESTGARAVHGPFGPSYDALRGESGPLGFPLGGQRSVAGGLVQDFQNGRIHFSASTGAQPVIGVVGSRYDALRGESGPLGFPVATQRTVTGGLVQDFQRGRIHYAPGLGAWEVTGAISRTYDSLHGESGPLGFPTGPAGTAGGVTTQAFTGGRIVSTASGTGAVYGEVARRYDSIGGAGVLGHPLANPRSAGGGIVQDFQGGRIHAGTAGPWEVHGPIAPRYDSLRGESGPLGFPTGAPTAVAGGYTQAFQNGSISWSAGTGAWAAVGAVGSRYALSGGPAGPLGFPVASERSVSGGVVQDFQTGRIHAGWSTGAWAVTGATSRVYDSLHGESGVLRFPVGAPRSVGGGLVQDFQGGRIFTKAGVGTFPTYGPIAARHDSLLGESGVLGFPVAAQRGVTGGLVQDFEHGGVHWSPATGAWAVTGAIDARYDSLGGESGRLGYPTGAATAVSGGVQQSFQRGAIAVDSQGSITVTYY